jgi:rhodanese-related sulfurtransferase
MHNVAPYKHISAEQVQQKLEGGEALTLVDVRTPGEYAAYHIAGSLLMPMNQFAERCRVELTPSDNIVLICEHGVRSEFAAQYLASLSYPKISTMDGGMSEYSGAVIRG